MAARGRSAEHVLRVPQAPPAPALAAEPEGAAAGI
eukprot:CAMPEP_0204602878 /NCGR_PEP_ID=MMETSP0661-20131031/56927_1 /ASSEMBLY_ACC=CAM_ASM_000606 /TAXON_ID=109239 /ORGANISM="Alexandrium margalefi, Strain AMGDE01CS-322" /LENGTH=34 /DNA_ID= /DNA_START= /DNA_END= /DNA_ORIENTATION=